MGYLATLIQLRRQFRFGSYQPPVPAISWARKPGEDFRGGVCQWKKGQALSSIFVLRALEEAAAQG